MVDGEYVIKFKCTAECNNRVIAHEFSYRTKTLSTDAIASNSNSDAYLLKKELADFDNNFKNLCTQK